MQTLDDTEGQELQRLPTTPDYQSALNIHEEANSSFLGKVSNFFTDVHSSGVVGQVDTAAFKEGDVVGAFTKPAMAKSAAAVSGVVGIVNSLRWVSNSILNHTVRSESEVQEYDDIQTSAVLSYVDDDWAKQYEAHKDTLDMAGFIATSFAPGNLGMKGAQLARAGLAAKAAPWIEQAGASGMIGRTMSRATGLLVPATERYVVAGAAEIAANRAIYQGINEQVVKSFIAGTINSSIDNIAFGIASSAVTFRSPILKDEDFGDIMSSAVTWGLVGGVLGGALESAVTAGRLNRFKEKFEQVTAPLTNRFQMQTAASPSLKLGAAAAELDVLPVLNKDTFAAEYLAKLPEGANFSPAQVEKAWVNAVSMRETKLRGIHSDMRTYMGELAEREVGGTGAYHIANQLTDDVLAAGTRGVDIANQFRGVTEITRLGDESLLTKQINKFLEERKAAGTLMDIKLTDYPEGMEQFVAMKGIAKGNIIDEVGNISLGIADTFATIGKIESAVKAQKFTTVTSLAKAGGDDLFKVVDTREVNSLRGELRWEYAKGLTKSRFGEKGLIADVTDIPVLQCAFELDVPVRVMQNGSVTAVQGADLQALLLKSKEDFIRKAMTVDATKVGAWDAGAVARYADVSPDAVTGKFVNKNSKADMFYNASESERIGRDARYTPQYVRMTVTPDPLHNPEMAGMVLDGMTYFKTMRTIVQDGIDNIVAKHVPPELQALFPKITDSELNAITSTGMSQGLFKSIASGMDGLKLKLGLVGQGTNKLRVAFRQSDMDTLSPVLNKLKAEPQALVEYSAINNKLLQTEERFVHYIDDELGAVMIPSKHKQFWSGEVPIPDEGMPALQEGLDAWGDGSRIFIKIENEATSEALATHIKLNAQNADVHNSTMRAQGYADTNLWNGDEYYPVRPDAKKFQHVALVEDTKIFSGGVGRIKRVVAPDGDTLSEMLSYIKKEDGFKVYTKGGTAEEKAAYAMASDLADSPFSDLRFDSTAKAKGHTALFFERTDPETILGELQDWHLTRADNRARSLVNAKYDAQFRELKKLAGLHEEFSESTLGRVDALEQAARNPYLDGIKLALDVQQANSKHPLMSMSEIADRTYTRAWRAVSHTLDAVKAPADLAKFGDTMKQYGLGTGYEDAMLFELANRGPVTGALNTLVRKANGLVGHLMLGWDTLNAINNAVGANIMLGKETADLMRSIAKASPEGAGELARLTTLGIPESELALKSGGKLIANAMKDYTQMVYALAKKDLNNPLVKRMNEYRERGYVKGVKETYIEALDAASQVGAVSEEVANGLIDKAWAGIKGTAKAPIKVAEFMNQNAEEANRFIAASVADQIAQVGLKHGVIDEGYRNAFIHAFVNRTQGTVLASQRPLMFSGAIGQALGLFQTYQLNMLQQLTKGVQTHGASSAGLMLGLQGTIYGLNGLPGFNIINQQLVGKATEGNQDLISTAYESMDKQAANLLIYGVAATVTQTNIYNRGDINPRQLTVIPLNPVDAPAVQILMSAAKNFTRVVGSVSDGNPLGQTLLQGLEHNALSRPLAGLGVTMQAALSDKGQAFTTSKQGNLTYANDLLTWASMSRLAGAKPLDESIVTDMVYRSSAYKAAQKKQMDKLGIRLKQEVLADGDVSPEAIDEVMTKYLAAGGKQSSFNAWMYRQMRNATDTQAQQIADKLNDPMSLRMQRMLGGESPDEGLEVTAEVAPE